MGILSLVTFFGQLVFKLLKMSLIPLSLLMIIIHFSDEIKAEQMVKNYSEVNQGSLLIRNSNGYFKQLPLIDTQVDLKISGMVARARVKQFFQNQSEDFIEASYVFPLPDDSAVDHMSMLIGERRIIGQIKEKSEAKKIYQQAKLQGKKTALLEQKRANIFTTKVANIAPGEVVEINIEYQQVVQFDKGEFSLRFPTAITPRYQPIETKIREQFSSTNENGWNDGSKQITSTSILPRNSGVENSISIDVELNAGIPLQQITSPYHNIVQQKKFTGNYQITLQNYQISDRDFELRWKAADSVQPRMALFQEQSKGDDYLLLMVTPPVTDNFKPMPRELTLVIDKSGSMEGASMVQAISALQQALSKLTSEDRFNVIAFSHQLFSLFEQPVAVNDFNLHLAERFVGSLVADGGTEMMPALEKALSEPASDGYLRQIVFLTDGAVSNEDDLFAVINNELDTARLFTIGIGSAPNSYFMRKAAQFGRGTFTYIGKPDEVAEKMQILFEQLESPVMQNIRVDWPADVEQFPVLIPDLYLGEPLVLRVKASQLEGEINISGEQGQTLWQATIPVSTTTKTSKDSSGIGVLWARAKISELLDSQVRTPSDVTIRQQVIDVALEHHLVSRFTSLVAVEQISTRPMEQSLKSKIMANHLPAGSTFNYPSTATGWKAQVIIGGLFLILSTVLIVFRKRLYQP